MSEEEIIEYLKNVIKTIQESDMLFNEPVNIRCGLKMEGAIQGLLDLYQKEKQKNEAMQEKIQHRLEMLERNKSKAIEHDDFINVADEAQIQLCKELLEERN